MQGRKQVINKQGRKQGSKLARKQGENKEVSKKSKQVGK